MLHTLWSVEVCLLWNSRFPASGSVSKSNYCCSTAFLRLKCELSKSSCVRPFSLCALESAYRDVKLMFMKIRIHVQTRCCLAMIACFRKQAR